MFKRNKITREIISNLPDKVDLPSKFSQFAKLKLPGTIEWSDIEVFQLKPSAKKEIVPFLNFDDGGILAFWYFEHECTIVYMGSEGELELISEDFESFLKLLCNKQTSLSIFDDSEIDFKISHQDKIINSDRLRELNKHFLAWCKEHTLLLEPETSEYSEKLRRLIMKIATDFLDDGLSKVYTKESEWWSLSFNIKRGKNRIHITYLDYGKWYNLPPKYELEKVVIELLELVKNKNKLEYELSVCSAGIVSIDRDTELVLEK